MKIISNKKKLIKILFNKKKIGFVPTMGAIHEGHMHLFRKSVTSCNKTVVSIYINKGQFNKTNDYKKYPRNLRRDISLIKSCNVDYLYLPTTKEIYPHGPSKKIKISPFAKKLCGKFRPGHFESVVDVVFRFLNIIKPNKIFLGKKDMQQLKVIEEFIIRNKINTKVIGCNIVRQKNGVPYSSRNFLLTKKNINIASKVYKLLLKYKMKAIKNKNILNKIKNKMKLAGVRKIDYVQLLNINKLVKPFRKNKKYKIFVAYYLNSTRLIDNI